jgi:hypothetical protein
MTPPVTVGQPRRSAIRGTVRHDSVSAEDPLGGNDIWPRIDNQPEASNKPFVLPKIV